MQKLIKIALFTACTLPLAMLAQAKETVSLDKVQAATGQVVAQTEVKRDNTTVISPRTGIRYTLGDTAGRPISLVTAAIVPATAATASRIVANNPALSARSQDKAKQTLLERVNSAAKP
ncbi:hypothetical protein [Acinetobacter larvae]|uniref:Uncharacterized protein n=1 Tax=Acinetobacter larvae TaxID=1789224 RepID=A0A1B2M2L7_9GAMM|nr:hypothetical protein [Acinetobacter larvae]AOA59263.1 hypothetical protein BFG52_13480 [Acinetobacter larvae]